MKKVLRKLFKKEKKKKIIFGKMGENVDISPNCIFMEPEGLEFGDNIYIGSDCLFQAGGGIKIGNGTIIAHRVEILTKNHNYDKYDLQSIPYDGTYILKEVTIGENVWIGSNVCIVPGIKIGEGAVIGMGAVVVSDIPPGAIVGGNPAKVLKYRDMKQYKELKENHKIYMELKQSGNVEYKEIRE